LEATAELDHVEVARILAEPDETEPPDLLEALHLIRELGIDANYSDLVQLAVAAGAEIADDMTAPDLAAQIWLKEPRLLERKEREVLCERRKSFESFRVVNWPTATSLEDLPPDLPALEAALRGYFKEVHMGAGCRVIPQYSQAEIRFYVRHGRPYRREPSWSDTQSTSTFFRPETTDLVILDVVHHELRIGAANAADLQKYREVFGVHLFGDPEIFRYAEKYTLEPLRSQGIAALRCRDVEGVDSVRLTQLEFDFGGAFENVVTERAQDVFKAMAIRHAKLPDEPAIRKAVFEVKLSGQSKPRTLSVMAGNRAAYQRGEESAIFEKWLRARGFVLEVKVHAEVA